MFLPYLIIILMIYYDQMRGLNGRKGNKKLLESYKGHFSIELRCDGPTEHALNSRLIKHMFQSRLTHKCKSNARSLQAQTYILHLEFIFYSRSSPRTSSANNHGETCLLEKIPRFLFLFLCALPLHVKYIHSVLEMRSYGTSFSSIERAVFWKCLFNRFHNFQMFTTSWRFHTLRRQGANLVSPTGFYCCHFHASFKILRFLQREEGM